MTQPTEGKTEVPVYEYHPIRQKMVWVLIIQSIATALVLAGVGAEVVEGWAQWLVGVLNILVLGGVLYRGTVEAEKNTTPLDDEGLPLNLEYAYLEHSPGPDRTKN